MLFFYFIYLKSTPKTKIRTQTIESATEIFNEENELNEILLFYGTKIELSIHLISYI